jgi:hypothetical protein
MKVFRIASSMSGDAVVVASIAAGVAATRTGG